MRHLRACYGVGGPVIRSGAGGNTLTGYAAVFYDPADRGSEYELFTGFVERLMPGCFDRALRERQDVACLLNHDQSRLLGRVSAGTLRLSVDTRGLRYECDLPSTATGDEVRALLARGDLRASSFGFIPQTTTSRTDGGKDICEVRDVDLYDVSPVTFPAYPSTTAGLRGAGGRALAGVPWAVQRLIDAEERKDMLHTLAMVNNTLAADERARRRGRPGATAACDLAAISALLRGASQPARAVQSVMSAAGLDAYFDAQDDFAEFGNE